MRGNISVHWPFDESFDFESKWPPVRDLIRKYGFDHRAVISSSFVLFDGTEDSAAELRARMAAVDLDFEVRWES